MPLLLADFIYSRDCKLNLRKNVDTTHDIKVKREVLKLAQLMLGLFCCSKTISYQ